MQHGELAKAQRKAKTLYKQERGMNIINKCDDYRPRPGVTEEEEGKPNTTKYNRKFCASRSN